jgi:choline dehydrogenase-like flavoprotein
MRGEEIFDAELRRLGIGMLAPWPPEEAHENGRWPANLEGGWHQIGTTRMHEDPRRGVVGPDCRVHGVENLFVAGGSVFPTCGDANPTLTIAALALRLGTHLRHELAR